MNRQELADWLIQEGLAEDLAGYGHPTGQQVADALFDAGIVSEDQAAPGVRAMLSDAWEQGYLKGHYSALAPDEPTPINPYDT